MATASTALYSTTTSGLGWQVQNGKKYSVERSKKRSIYVFVELLSQSRMFAFDSVATRIKSSVPMEREHTDWNRTECIWTRTPRREQKRTTCVCVCATSIANHRKLQMDRFHCVYRLRSSLIWLTCSSNNDATATKSERERELRRVICVVVYCGAQPINRSTNNIKVPVSPATELHSMARNRNRLNSIEACVVDISQFRSASLWTWNALWINRPMDANAWARQFAHIEFDTKYVLPPPLPQSRWMIHSAGRKWIKIIMATMLCMEMKRMDRNAYERECVVRNDNKSFRPICCRVRHRMTVKVLRCDGTAATWRIPSLRTVIVRPPHRWPMMVEDKMWRRARVLYLFLVSPHQRRRPIPI